MYQGILNPCKNNLYFYNDGLAIVDLLDVKLNFLLKKKKITLKLLKQYNYQNNDLLDVKSNFINKKRKKTL